MSFADQITAAPIPFDADIAAEIKSNFSDLSGPMRDLVVGTAASSRFLCGVIRKEADWLRDLAAGDVDEVLARTLVIEGNGFDALSTALRRAKQRAALLIGLADLGGVWSLDQVTGALTALADASVQTALSYLVNAEQARGKLPETDRPDGGLFAIAMGKMGAGELNYSSDIDLILLFDESLYPGEDYPDIRKSFVRITQRMVKLLSDNTADGYVFRTDLRLRPDPSVTPVCIGMGAAERYYETQGRTWERAAMIKARIAAGDQQAGEAFLEALTPFVWRKNLDFAALQDAHDMRLRIRKHKGLGGPLTLPGHDVKLGRGGIREIEFLAQTQQLIHGGRDPGLRDRRTLVTLADLADRGWLPAEMRDALSAAYVEHRTLEHRLQMIDDAQTQTYPTEEPARRRVAALCGRSDFAAFEAELTERFAAVHTMTEAFFVPQQTQEEDDPWCGFDDPEAARDTAAAWNTIPALRSARAEEIFARLEPMLAPRLADAPRPMEALAQFDVFLRGLPAGVQLFSLFEANPKLMDLLVEICATAPRLAEYLGRNARVFDAVLDPGFFEPTPDAAALGAALSLQLADSTDYETVLDAARRWQKERRFQIGVQLLRRLINPYEAGVAYSALAEATLFALLPHVTREHARRYGNAPGQGAAVVAMGKLGSREMTATSDLDLIVIYDAPLDAISDGPRGLMAGPYYAKLTQALISALTAQTAEGTLYPVDMRLRPSGRQGPVATGLTAFRTYQKEEAWTWEHLALTRARPLAGPAHLMAQIREAIDTVLAEPQDTQKVIHDTGDMRRRLFEANSKAADNPWEVKLGPGRMLDIELLLQAGALLSGGMSQSPRDMAAALAKSSWLDASDAGGLSAALELYTAVQQIARLCLGGRIEAGRTGRGLWQLLCHATDHPSAEALQAALADAAARAGDIITRRIGAA
ncbi:bifunctional [glutamine synthetase] adenylyltransferase/[glutamine synthetase]-adenylyl-L-tyrosine phosphorylase [Halovulum sp. GXIMD14793]